MQTISTILENDILIISKKLYYTFPIRLKIILSVIKKFTSRRIKINK